MTKQSLCLVPQKGAGASLTPAQKMFNRLITKVKKLQQQQKEVIQDLDASLQFYYEMVLPEETRLQKALAERIKLAHHEYKNPKNFTQQELEGIRGLIEEDLDILFSIAGPADITAEIKAIFEEMNGVSFEERSLEIMELMKHEIQEKFKASGIQTDLSSLNINDPKEKIMQDMFNSIGKAFSKQPGANKKTSKTKKQLEKELRREAFEELQKKSLNTIYRQLARALHPDLEQDPEQRLWKEGVMKKLASAYKKGDLYELLTIEMEFLNRSNDKLPLQSHEQLEIYNAILKDQEKDLQADIAMLPMHPKYMPLQEFFGSMFGIDVGIKLKYQEIRNDVHVLQQHVTSLLSKDAHKLLKRAIKERRAANK